MPGDEQLVQLDLFTPHRLALGEAWDALADLEVERAAALFDALAARYPDSREVADGVRIAHHWQVRLTASEGLPLRERVRSLWEAVRECPDELATSRLRRRLLEELWQALDGAGVTFLPPDLPAGRLALALDRPAEAVRSLTQASREHPGEPVVQRCLAEAEWALGHARSARVLWTRLLLAAPEAVEEDAVPDEEVRLLIARHGVGMAALHGWLEGVLPLLAELPEGVSGAAGRRAYECLLAAEDARRRQDHEGMVAARLALKQEAPAAFAAYLARLEIAAPRG